MLTTNRQELSPEIMDVLRPFGAEEENFTHFCGGDGDYYYDKIEYGGKVYEFEERIKTNGEAERKRYTKRCAKLAFYKVLSGIKGVSLPYGALTGIRPTKLAYMETAAGRDYKKTFAHFGVSQENIDLVRRVIEGQKEIYDNRGGQDLFVSIPFCPTKCEYCSFITAPLATTRKYVEEYVNCLIKEIESVKDLLDNPKSIYIGGGTPFAIEKEQLGRIYAAINALGLKNCEYTVEAGRPDVFDEDKLKLSKDFGVTRICVNPQSFNDSTLEKIGRKHTAAQTLAAYESAKKYGFDINLDLIAGLADETLEDFICSLKTAIELEPANVTVHTLCLKSGAKLKENVHKLGGEAVGEMVAYSREALTAAGYIPYYLYRQKYQAGGHENCGWAKKSKACVYNVDVMEEISDNVAVGANAISKRVFSEMGGSQRIERYASPKNVPTYIEKVDKIIRSRRFLFLGAKKKSDEI